MATQSISSLRSTLPGESWRTLLQTFLAKVFLTLSFNARTASELCGKEEQLKFSESQSENDQDGRCPSISDVVVIRHAHRWHQENIGQRPGLNLL